VSNVSTKTVILSGPLSSKIGSMVSFYRILRRTEPT